MQPSTDDLLSIYYIAVFIVLYVAKAQCISGEANIAGAYHVLNLQGDG